MRTYTQEEKQAVIDRVISGELSTHILADTGIPKSTFYGWLRTYREEQEADNRRTVSIRNFHLLENKVDVWRALLKFLNLRPAHPRHLWGKGYTLPNSFTANTMCTWSAMRLTFPAERFTTTFSAIRKTTRGMQNAVKNYGFAYRRSTTKAIRFLVLPKLRQLWKVKDSKSVTKWYARLCVIWG